MQNSIDINLSSHTIDNIINEIEEEEQSKLSKIINNYEKLVNANINNLKRMLDNENNKSVIVYNLGLLIELFLKMILLKFGLSDISEIGEYNHQISDMYKFIFDNIKESKVKRVCENIKERSSIIRQSNGYKVNYNDYTNFRYNHKKDEFDLIFDEEININDIKHIREVIECIESIMK